MSDKVIINCLTHEVSMEPQTPQDIADQLKRAQDAAAEEAAQLAKEAEKQAAINELKKSAQGQHVLKVLGIE